MNNLLREELNKRFAAGGMITDVDLHVHTVLSDGNSSAEEVVRAAIDKGIKVLGFSDHSVVPGEDWCMSPSQEIEYREKITELKSRFGNVIAIFCGIEQDSLSGRADPFYDYVVGSAHAVKAGEGIVWVDSDPAIVDDVVEKYYGGDYYNYAETYYDGLSKVYETTGCDIVAHFDILTKFNEKEDRMELSHPRYIKAWKSAADKLCGKGLIFEINTGGISRGYRSSPYPSADIREYLLSKGEKLLLSSDSHHSSTVAYQFEKWASREGIC